MNCETIVISHLRDFFVVRVGDHYGNIVVRIDRYRSSAEAAHRMGAWPWKSPVRRPRM
jgi:hypothetical protein